MHGWIGTILNDVNIETKAAIFESGKPANIFVVDWSIPAGQFYPFAVWSIPSVGQIIANYIDEMINHFGIDGSDFILVGHSIGAHLAGVVGSNLNGTIGHIVELDPVWEIFSDECRIESVTDGALYARRRPSERYKDECLVKTVKHPPAAMIWS
ncbi:lipase [Holotrichia oblita]|uniref:Lipase n=2 Tax=Holotrichia oblita TaxID=644536 RepID=A0ACB9T6R7_HOLOL|nr:lipase [Holotrichia oblita]KAI4462430.1 lipase [Holotrichia oblita]